MNLDARHVIMVQCIEEQRPLLYYAFPLPAATLCYEFHTKSPSSLFVLEDIVHPLTAVLSVPPWTKWSFVVRAGTSKVIRTYEQRPKTRYLDANPGLFSAIP